MRHAPAGRGSGIGSLYFGQQLGWPAAAAEDRVGDDAVIAQRQQVHVMRRVRHAVLRPAERVLDNFARPAVD
jgi:hypothetical protein